MEDSLRATAEDSHVNTLHTSLTHTSQDAPTSTNAPDIQQNESTYVSVKIETASSMSSNGEMKDDQIIDNAEYISSSTVVKKEPQDAASDGSLSPTEPQAELPHLNQDYFTCTRWDSKVKTEIDEKFICPVCLVVVSDDDKALQCDSVCDKWIHIHCIGLSEAEYVTLGDTDDSWICPFCPNDGVKLNNSGETMIKHEQSDGVMIKVEQNISDDDVREDISPSSPGEPRNHDDDQEYNPSSSDESEFEQSDVEVSHSMRSNIGVRRISCRDVENTNSKVETTKPFRKRFQTKGGRNRVRLKQIFQNIAPCETDSDGEMSRIVVSTLRPRKTRKRVQLNTSGETMIKEEQNISDDVREDDNPLSTLNQPKHCGDDQEYNPSSSDVSDSEFERSDVECSESLYSNIGVRRISCRDVENTNSDVEITKPPRKRYRKIGVRSREQNNYECEECDLSFATRQFVMRHYREVHKGEKPFKCKMCDYRGARKEHMRVHIMRHTGERPFKCNECHTRFHRKNDLVVHWRVHTGEKPFKCRECDFASSRRGNLKTHLNQHAGKKPFKCWKCHFTATVKSSVKAHMRLHHNFFT